MTTTLDSIAVRVRDLTPGDHIGWGEVVEVTPGPQKYELTVKRGGLRKLELRPNTVVNAYRRGRNVLDD